MVLPVAAAPLEQTSPPRACGSSEEGRAGALSVEELYDEHADYVYRSLRRLGVAEPSLQDALQDVFLVIHRRLPEFRAHDYARQWLFVIALRVARNYRRTGLRHRPEHEALAAGLDPDMLSAAHACDPVESIAHAERVRVFYLLLDALDEDKRAVFVLAELEQMSVPEIASTLRINVNTAYARLRSARQTFERALSRYRFSMRGSHE